MHKKTVFVFALLVGTVALVACGSGESASETAESTETSMSSAVSYPECSARGNPEELAERPSPLTEVAVDYENGVGTLCYGAPSARGREVMGGLVPFGTPWRAGATNLLLCT